MPTSRKILLLVALLLVLPAWPAAALAEPMPKDFEVVSIDAQTLLFRRARPAGGGTEGFVVDADALVDTLKSRVLEARALGSVATITRVADESPSERRTAPVSPAAEFEFRHRFAEPFASISTRMALRPLDDPSEGALVDELVVTLALAVVLGLYALYRMTRTQLVFAERSRNFVSAVSHELKTPLTAIRMYGEMLSDDLVPDDAKRREYYRTITQESERLTRLIDNVLNLSRLERRRELHLRSGDIRPYLRDAIEVLRNHVQQQGFQLMVDFDERVSCLQFEPDALKQLLFNLVDNSVKYGRDASDKRVFIELRGTPEGARLLVRDFGPGVDPSHIHKIFLPFFRGERELTRKFTGTGIGLALVKSLVLAMHGRVTAGNLNPGFQVAIDLVAGPTD